MPHAKIIRSLKQARSHHTTASVLIEVPGDRVTAVVSLIQALEKPGANDVGRRIEALRALASGNPAGVVVTNVVPASQGAAVGMKRGDVLFQYDGQQIDTSGKLKRLAELTPPAKRVSITAKRGTQDLNFQVSGGRLGITVNTSL